MKGNRLAYIDMVKGVGIILVVIGHSTYVSEGVLTWLASFHMPLFLLFRVFYSPTDIQRGNILGLM